jgi:hypothetical protein
MRDRSHRLPRPALLFGALMLWAGLAAVLGCHRPAADAPSASESAKPGLSASGAADPFDQPITAADVQSPTNYADAVRRIRAYRDQIAAAIESGQPAKAHRPLDELDIVIGTLMPMARDCGVPRASWENVNTAARELRRQFDRLHAAIDDRRQPDYPAAAPAIDAALRQLEITANELPRTQNPKPKDHGPEPKPIDTPSSARLSPCC